jgi:mono/diheme cytochrome c family protein
MPGVANANVARQNYILHCAGCHQPDGGGSARHDVPRMRDVVGHFLRTPEGRAFLVQVPGTSNSGLDDAQVAELLNWMLPAFSAGQMPPDFNPYTRDEVARLRAHKLDDVASHRSAVVRQLRALGYAVP